MEPSRNCDTMKTGRFTSYLVIGNDSLNSNFERNATVQVELFDGKNDTFDLRWLNDCEYVLKKRNPSNRYEAKSNHIKILTTTDSSYTFEFNIVGESKKLKGTAIKY